jgi:hypothetical protein
LLGKYEQGKREEKYKKGKERGERTWLMHCDDVPGHTSTML